MSPTPAAATGHNRAGDAGRRYEGEGRPIQWNRAPNDRAIEESWRIQPVSSTRALRCAERGDGAEDCPRGGAAGGGGDTSGGSGAVWARMRARASTGPSVAAKVCTGGVGVGSLAGGTRERVPGRRASCRPCAAGYAVRGRAAVVGPRRHGLDSGVRRVVSTRCGRAAGSATGGRPRFATGHRWCAGTPRRSCSA